MIYYVIIGLAVTEALRITFVGQGGEFLGIKTENKTEILLLLVFLFTLVRFVHGASIHLEMDKKNPNTTWKPLWDFAGFVLHGSLFYMTAISLKKLSNFLGLFAWVVGVDAVWILLPCRHYIKKLDFIHKQWLKSDISLIFACLFLIFVGGKWISDFGSAIIILIIAIVAAVLDYFWVLFPKKRNYSKTIILNLNRRYPTALVMISARLFMIKTTSLAILDSMVR